MKARSTVALSGLQKHSLKVVSLLFSLVLWFYVLSTAPEKGSKVVPINFDLPPGIVIENEVPQEVQFELNGPKAFMRSILDRNDLVTLDVEKYVKNKWGNVKIRPTDYPLPIGVKVLSIKPSSIKVKLGKKFTKKIPLEPQLQGTVKANYKLISSKIKPSHILLEGPKKILKSVDSIKTAPININELENKGELKVQIVGIDPRIKLAPSKDQKRIFKDFQFSVKDIKVEYFYNIKPTTANFILKNLPIRFLTSRRVVAPSHRLVSISVYSEEGESLKVSKSDIQIIADIPEGIKGRQRIKLQANLPGNIHLLKIHPAEITLTIR